MDADKTSFKFRSHNINGFNNSKEFIFQECSSESFDILALQEHWLKPSHKKHAGINLMKSLHPMYDSYSTSAMNIELGKHILKGRPYGGTGFIFHKSLSKCLRARTDLAHERISVMELCTVSENIILINAYMPYFKTDGNAEQLIDYRNTLAFIENIMTSHTQHKFLLFMDFNCNLFNHSHPYSSLINKMIDDFNLTTNYTFISQFDSSQEYTRFDLKRNSFTLIDGILISKSLSYLIQKSNILHPPTNVSDHLPVEISLSLEIDDFLEEESRVTNFIPWASLSTDELSIYRDSMASALKDIDIPFSALNHNSRLCGNCNCLVALEKFHDNIVSGISIADS